MLFHSNKVYIPLISSEWLQIANDPAYIKHGAKRQTLRMAHIELQVP